MNIRQHIAVEQLAAGGPGSGRHPEFDGVLKPEAGWKKKARRTDKFIDNQGGLKTVWRHPVNGSVRVADDKSWEHVSRRGFVVKEGKGSRMLEKHIAGYKD